MMLSRESNRLRHLCGWALWQLRGDPPARVGETMARATLYPTSRRQIIAVPASTTITVQPFDRAREAFHRTYGRAYVEGARHAVDEADRLQAHQEALDEGLQDAIAAYEETA